VELISLALLCGICVELLIDFRGGPTATLRALHWSAGMASYLSSAVRAVALLQSWQTKAGWCLISMRGILSLADYRISSLHTAKPGTSLPLKFPGSFS